MSEENVEAVRASFERFNRERYLPEDLFDPAIELSNVRESPLPGPYRGYEGLRKWSDDLCEVLKEPRFEIEDQIDVDAESAVITRVRLCGRARHTEIAIDYPFTIVAWVRNGLTYHSEGFTDHAAALKAAGLQE